MIKKILIGMILYAYTYTHYMNRSTKDIIGALTFLQVWTVLDMLLRKSNGLWQNIDCSLKTYVFFWAEVLSTQQADFPFQPCCSVHSPCILRVVSTASVMVPWSPTRLPPKHNVRLLDGSEANKTTGWGEQLLDLGWSVKLARRDHFFLALGSKPARI